MVAVLGRFKVRYVLAGGVAARLHGYPWMSAVVEIVPAIAPNDFEALATALKHLSAQISTEGTPEGLPFETTADALARAANWSFITTCGRLDVRFKPEGSDGYAALAPAAVKFQLHGDTILVASLNDIIQMKEATGRAQERQEAVVLRELARRGREYGHTA
jgi:hypothetical protein